MKILILTFYFYPDLCAGSFRASSIVNALEKRLGESQIDVITTTPNRYKSYKVKAPINEERGNVRIKRISVPTHESGMIDQAWAFKSFAWGAIREAKGKDYDIVVATTSRLMTGLLGMLISKRIIKTKLFLDIRDIFTDTMEDILKSKIWSPTIRILKLLEKRMVLKAEKVNLISPGFLNYYKKIVPNKNFSLFTNGIDEEFLNYNFNQKFSLMEEEKTTILYAGNIGDGQGLHRIIPQAAKLLEKDYLFYIIGDGGTRADLEKELQKEGVKNVKLIPPMKRAELIKYYSSADILFVHLNEYKAFQKVIPSKLFEYAATGKPILAGVGGYPKEFIKENIPNAEVFSPCNAEDLKDKLKVLDLKNTHRKEFEEKYSTKKIAESLAGEIIQCCRGEKENG